MGNIFVTFSHLRLLSNRIKDFVNEHYLKKDFTINDQPIIQVVTNHEAKLKDFPQATLEDTGKFLRVDSNGKYILELLIDVSEVGL